MAVDKCVSIIVPVYKVEKYLNRCIKSIISQTYRKLEIILIDDGSPDRCPQICDEFAGMDNRIKVLHQSNMGPSKARNRGLELCTGDFVMFVDSDDFINVHVIERWVGLLEKYDADMIVGKHENYYGKKESEELIKLPLKDSQVIEKSTEQILEDMFLRNHKLCVAWGKLYRREVLRDFKFAENVFFGEDMLAAHILFDRAKKILEDEFIGVFYNQEGESLVRSGFSAKKLDMITASEEWVEFVKIKYPDLIQAAFFRRTLIVTNLCGDIVYWNDPSARNLFLELSGWINENWNKIRKNKFFTVKELLKALIVKNNLFGLMRVYRRLRLLIS